MRCGVVRRARVARRVRRVRRGRRVIRARRRRRSMRITSTVSVSEVILLVKAASWKQSMHTDCSFTTDSARGTRHIWGR